jgi:hypothetical protein
VGEQSSGTRYGAEVLPLSARAVSRPTVKILAPGRFHRLPCSSPPSDTKTGAISPKQTPLEHAPGGRPARPPRPPAAQPPPVRKAAMTAWPVPPLSQALAAAAPVRASLARAARCHWPARWAGRTSSTASATVGAGTADQARPRPGTPATTPSMESGPGSARPADAGASFKAVPASRPGSIATGDSASSPYQPSTGKITPRLKGPDQLPIRDPRYRSRSGH